MDAKRLAYLRSLAVTARDNPATWDERDCPMVALIAALEPAMIVELIDGRAPSPASVHATTLIAIATTGALCEECPTPWTVEKMFLPNLRDLLASIFEPDEVISEPAFAYLCEWIFERPDDLPAPHNRPVGLLIVEHRTTSVW